MPNVSRNELERIVGHVSQVAVKHWLKVNGFPHTAVNTDDFYELLSKLITEGKLSIDKLRLAALEIEENGGKRIYLRKVESLELLRDREAFAERLRKKRLTLADNTTASIKTPNEPVINYIFWEDKGLRIKGTETNIELNIDMEKRSIVERKVTKFVIVLLDFASGFMQVRMDPPSEIHPHKNSYDGQSDPQEYEAFWFGLFGKILGVEDAAIFDLTGKAERIVNYVPRIFRLPVETVRTGDNSRQRYSNRDDVRDDRARRAAAQADSDNWVYEDLQGYWLSEQSNGQLQRDLFMQLKRKPAMVRFYADCLASEVDYALSRIRNL